MGRRGGLPHQVSATNVKMRGIPFFSRSQLGVILLLGAALSLLWAWRANFWLPPSPPPGKTLNLVFVEVTGAAAHPGVYSFDHPPTLAEVWRRAGGPETRPSDDQKLASGSRVEITPAGRYRLARMSGPQLLTLGLALDLNAATAQDLEALPGIGPVLARRILDYRTAHGQFKKIDDLMQVSGIGPKKLEKMRLYLVISETGETADERR
jgi:competence ComEA-like helix-hairpin-helix protein